MSVFWATDRDKSPIYLKNKPTTALNDGRYNINLQALYRNTYKADFSLKEGVKPRM